MREVTVELRLLSTEQGGRTSAISADMLGCIMVLDGRNFDVRLHLDGVGSLQPGQEVTVPVSFLDFETARTVLKGGQEFLLREMRTIGKGTIKEIKMSVQRG